jgi:hypothetical protein
MELLAKIQQGLKAPKNKKNDFGGYAYRSASDILEAVKPLLNGAYLTLSDEVTAVADRIYVKATATLTNGQESVSATAFARESLARKGMDDAQITGGASSYARKYALCGLFAIDDSAADPDESHNHGKSSEKKKVDASTTTDLLVAINEAGTLEELKKAFSCAWKVGGEYADEEARKKFKEAYEARKNTLEKN